MTVNRISAGAAACCAAMLLSACGGSTPATGVAPVSATTVPSGGGAGGGGGGGVARGFPGATGLLAQIDGTTLQVQATDAQTAVTYSAATTFTNTVAARFSSVAVGDCVQARSARPASGAGGAAPTAAPGATDGPIVAASVEISAAVNGRCSAFGGLRTPGGRPPGATGGPTRPAGAPTPGGTRGPGAGGNGAGGNGFGGLGAFGKVTAINGSSFTVESSRPGSGTATTATTAVPTTRIITTSTATTYTRTAAASAKALVVGLCVTALGKASDTGSIAATSITLRPAENGSCSSGFGRRGPGGIPTSAGGGSGA
jgi:hypothetical protein